MILKTNKNVYEVMFFDMQNYVYSESVFNTLYIVIKYKFKKHFLRTKQAMQKMPSFIFGELHLITVSLLVCDAYMS